MIAWCAAFLAVTRVSGQEVPVPSPRPEQPPVAPAPAVCLILPLSGPHAGLGRRALRSLEGVLGDGATVRVLDSDDPGPATQVGKARDSGCVLAIGGLGDRESRTMSEAAEAVAMPLLALGQDPDDRARAHVISVRTPRSETVAAVARHGIETAKRTAAHVLVPDTPFGREVAWAFRAAFEAGGGRVRTERAVPLAEDLAKAAAAFAAERGGADDGRPCEGEVLFLGYDLARALRLVSLLEFEGVPVRKGKGACPPLLITGTGLWNDPARVSRLGDDLGGARFADVALPEGEGDVLDAEVRDAAFLARALLAAGMGSRSAGGTGTLASEDGAGGAPDAIARWAEGLAFHGATGDLAVRGGRVVGRTIGVFELRQGEIRRVDGDAARAECHVRSDEGASRVCGPTGALARVGRALEGSE